MTKNIVIAVLAVALAYDSVVALKNQKTLARSHKRYEQALATQHYLAKMLDDNGIDLDDLDKMELSFLNS